MERIREAAGQRGWATYLVGGVVRDLLLGRPTKDLDVVVVGNALEVAAEVARSERGSYTEHRTFGTASIELDDRLRIDVATARRESYARPAALPRTAPSGLEDDLTRRDFSINSMALDISPEHFGTVIDPCGGRTDLRRGMIRVLHERSFLDDPTRILRALRFANRLKFSIEDDTLDLMRAATGAGLFDRLSATRVRRELELIFAEGDWADIVVELEEVGVWPAILPGLGIRRGDRGRVERAESWADWYGDIDRAEAIRRWVLALGAMTHSRIERERLAARLRPDGRDGSALIDAPERAKEILSRLRSTRHPLPSQVCAVCDGAGTTACLLALAGTRPGAIRQAICAYLLRWRSLEADITGDDLLREGVPAGPRVGVGLRAALEAKLDGRAPDSATQLNIAILASRQGA